MFPEIEMIKIKRKRLGLTQKKLAELVGVSQPLIARIESGDFDPKLSLVRKIFEVLEEVEGKAINAEKIMNSPVKVVETTARLREAVEIMMKHGISQMPIVKKSKVVGSITESGVVKIMLEKGVAAGKIRVEECMEAPFPTVSKCECLDTISKLLLSSPAVLVSERSKLLGIITKHDVMKAIRF